VIGHHVRRRRLYASKARAARSTAHTATSLAVAGSALAVASPTPPATLKTVNEVTVNAAANRPTRPACCLKGCPWTKDIVPRNDTPQGLNSWANPATAASPTSTAAVMSRFGC